MNMKNVRLAGIIIPIFLFAVSTLLTSCLDDGLNVDDDTQILNNQIDILEAYFNANNIDANEIGNGYYQVVLLEGTGDSVKSDDIVELKYHVRKYDTQEVLFFDSSYVFTPENGFHVNGVTGNIASLNFANSLMNENNISEFYLASIHLFGQASGIINDVIINPNQMGIAHYELLDIRTEEEQKVFEDNKIQEELSNMGQEGSPSLTGLYTIILEEGTGEDSVSANDVITIDYIGTLLDGTEFDSGTDATLTLSDLIDGWVEGLLNKKQGTKLILLIPSHLAYGPTGVIRDGIIEIPSFSPLKFEISLDSIH